MRIIAALMGVCDSYLLSHADRATQAVRWQRRSKRVTPSVRESHADETSRVLKPPSVITMANVKPVAPVAAKPVAKPVAPVAKPVASVAAAPMKPVAPVAVPTASAPIKPPKKPMSEKAVARAARTPLRKVVDAFTRLSNRCVQVGEMLKGRTDISTGAAAGGHLIDGAQYINAALEVISAFPADFKLNLAASGLQRASRAALVIGAPVKIAQKRLEQYKSMTDNDDDLLKLTVHKVTADGKRVVVATDDGIRFPVSARHLRARPLSIAEQTAAAPAAAAE